MNILQRLFHRHKWQTIASKELEVCSIGNTRMRPGLVVLKMCNKCDAEYCYMTDGVNSTTLDRDFVKMRHKM